jgi:hypothetical protein
MNAIFKHEYRNGMKLQMCVLCNLKVDDYGFPDPRWYSSKFMEAYYRASESSRCKHIRAIPPVVSEREKRYEKALYAALGLIKEALFTREDSEDDR